MSGRWFRPNFHVESFLRSIIQESHINHRSELSGGHFHVWAMILSKLWFWQFLKIHKTREPHHSKKWAIWRPFPWVGDVFVQVLVSRVSWDLYYKRATSLTEVSYLETIFMSGRWFRPNFDVESFLKYRVQKSRLNHRNELSGDHFHEWLMISSKFSCREFLEIYNTGEPHQSQKWVIWRPFSWVAMILSKLWCRQFIKIHKTSEPHHSQKWATWRPFPWVGDVVVQFLMSRVSWDLYYKRATSFTEVSYLETIFMSERWFPPNFHVEIFFRYIVQKSQINHRSDLSGDHFHEWALISSNFSCREFLEIYNTREPYQSQKWGIWRPFSWVGDDFVQIIMLSVSWDL